MPITDSYKKYYRFATGLRKFYQHSISLAESERTLHLRMEKREQLFLNLIDKAIYQNPNSPYLQLLEFTGYQFEHIKQLVRDVGIEQALVQLAKDGVYLSFDEFKCRTKVTRGGKVFNFHESDFDNPLLASYFDVETGATTSAGTRTLIDFDFLKQEASHRAVVLDMFGLMDAPCLLWFPLLPGNAGIVNYFRQVKINRPPLKWFYQVDTRKVKPVLKDRLGMNFVITTGRLFGRMPSKPEYVDLQEAGKIVQYLADIIQKYRKCSLWTYVNSAVRICSQADKQNLKLEGVTFFVAGEPLTATKFNEIKACGAKAVSYYGCAEGGILAYGCPHADSPDDMHVLKDHVAVISHHRQMENGNRQENALLFTSLFAESPKVLLNVETGDHGSITSRQCGCEFAAFGFTDHLSNVRSFEKLNNEGMTFMIDRFVHIIEEILPEKYGGTSSDYQIIEGQDQDGVDFISLLINPEIGTIDEQQVLKTIKHELQQGKDCNRMMAEVWSKGDTIRIKRIAPIPTKRGKIFPFRRTSQCETD